MSDIFVPKTEGYHVDVRRIVPHRPGYQHAGKHAVIVVLDSGFRAWGFASDWPEAEANALNKARALEQADTSSCCNT
tara:strand:+ start:10889 stop:11119 length:231 start_codon:yes stop_codon:yes gene_type:complete